MSEEAKPAEAEPSENGEERFGVPWRLRVFLRWARMVLLYRLPPEEAREVRRAVEAEGAFSERFALLSALSAGIAALGLLQSSPAVVIGAMLVSPLMGPIAALGFGFASLDAKRIQSSAQVLGVGAAIGVGVSLVITLLSPMRDPTPEIIARTAPTLLDLAVALLSGIAGGYASVHRKGETAIGVAIATALMPPLATVGYSLAVLRFDFAAGAGLLFLTNLAAISFSFALVARQRGVARPLSRVEFKPFHVVLGAIAFLMLATPLALTLRQITQEAYATSTARHLLADYFGVDGSQVAQLSVTWPNLEPPRVEATVITPAYRVDASSELEQRLATALRARPTLTLNQVVAADVEAQTRALIDAALSNQPAAEQRPTPPIEQARAASILPVDSAWADADQNTIYLRAVALEGVRLRDYRTEEARLDALIDGWRVRIIPPFRERLFLPFASGSETPDYATLDAAADARWALTRWNVRRIGLEGLAGRRTDASAASRTLAQARVTAASRMEPLAGFELSPVVASRDTAEALFAEGGDARVTGVDIRVRPNALPSAQPEAASTQ